MRPFSAFGGQIVAALMQLVQRCVLAPLRCSWERQAGCGDVIHRSPPARHERFRRSNAYDRARGALPKPYGHLWSPGASGNRGGVCARVWKVDRYVSSVTLFTLSISARISMRQEASKIAEVLACVRKAGAASTRTSRAYTGGLEEKSIDGAHIDVGWQLQKGRARNLAANSRRFTPQLPSITGVHKAV